MRSPQSDLGPQATHNRRQGEDMKLARYLVLFALAFCAFAGASNAQSIQFLGGGSSALALELGQAAVNLNGGTGVACTWTLGKNSNILARDNRTSTPTDE